MAMMRVRMAPRAQGQRIVPEAVLLAATGQGAGAAAIREAAMAVATTVPTVDLPVSHPRTKSRLAKAAREASRDRGLPGASLEGKNHLPIVIFLK